MGLNGFIKIHRKLIEWGWYSDSVVKDVFIHLLIIASWKDSTYLGYELHPGDAVIGLKKLANELGFSTQQVRTALNKLESTGEITKKSTNKFTIVSVENWAFYQCDDDIGNKRATNEQQTSNKRATNEQQHLKNNKNIKNVKNNKNTIYAQVPVELAEPLKEFEQHRTKLKAPLTAHALKLLITKLQKLSGGDVQTMIAILNQSIEQGWKGVFELEKPKKRNEVLDMLKEGLFDD